MTISAATWRLDLEGFKGRVQFKDRAEHSTLLKPGPKLSVINGSDEIRFGRSDTMWKNVAFHLGERSAVLRYRATNSAVGATLTVDGDVIEAVEREWCQTAERVSILLAVKFVPLFISMLLLPFFL